MDFLLWTFYVPFFCTAEFHERKKLILNQVLKELFISSK
jgi:hypothetical protein